MILSKGKAHLPGTILHPQKLAFVVNLKITSWDCLPTINSPCNYLNPNDYATLIEYSHNLQPSQVTKFMKSYNKLIAQLKVFKNTIRAFQI